MELGPLKRIKQRKGVQGFTLVELSVSLALVILLLTVVFSYLVDSVRWFNVGVSQSQAQRNLQLVALQITKELRSAVEIKLLPDASHVPSSVPEESGANYLFLKDGLVWHLNSAGSSIISPDPVESLSFELRRLDSGANVVSFSISAAAGSKELALESKVLLNNIKGVEEMVGLYHAVEYVKP